MCFLTVWWLIPAIVSSAGLTKDNGTTMDNAVVAFSWMNVFFHAGLAVLAFVGDRRGDDGGGYGGGGGGYGGGVGGAEVPVEEGMPVGSDV